jgi:hypothetical protein
LAALFNTPIDIILGRESDEFSEKIDYTRGLQLLVDDAILNAKVTGIPREFLYHVTSLALPNPYYQILYEYRRDPALQEIFALWKKLDFYDKREMIGYGNALVRKKNKKKN